MKGGSRLFIFAGVGLALVAIALLVSNLGGGGKSNAEDPTPTVEMGKIIVARGVINEHQLLTTDKIVEKQIPLAEVPPDAITSLNEALGMAYRVPLAKGDTLMRSFLETPGLRNDITPGKRAIAMPIGDLSSMSGLLQDGDYIDIIFNARVNFVRVTSNGAGDYLDDEETMGISTSRAERAGTPEAEGAVAEEGSEDVVDEEGDELTPTITATAELPDSDPLPGENGSIFVIRDELGSDGELEAVAKITVQDVRILRVVRPGDRFLADGSRASASTAEGTEQTAAASSGQVILEVTPQQAEVINFLQDQHHSYQLIVRGTDDHELVTTTGVTYDILATEEDGLPFPKSIEIGAEGEIVSERGAATPVAVDSEEQPDENAGGNADSDAGADADGNADEESE